MSPTDIGTAAADEHLEHVRDDAAEQRAAPAGEATGGLNIAARPETSRPWLPRLELSQHWARGPLAGRQAWSKPMFGKHDLVDDLSRDLDRARERRDALASDVTTLTAQISEIEARLSVERDRRERERVAGEIDEIKRRLEETATVFAPAVSGLCHATETAAAVVPEARKLNALLGAVATEIGAAISPLLRELVCQAEAVRSGHVAPRLSRSLSGAQQTADARERQLRPATRLSRESESEQEKAAADPHGITAYASSNASEISPDK
jgi:hypothetical protein